MVDLTQLEIWAAKIQGAKMGTPFSRWVLGICKFVAESCRIIFIGFHGFHNTQYIWILMQTHLSFRALFGIISITLLNSDKTKNSEVYLHAIFDLWKPALSDDEFPQQWDPSTLKIDLQTPLYHSHNIPNPSCVSEFKNWGNHEF